jgi:hypothetical protein
MIGQLHEKTYDVAVFDDRSIGSDGRSSALVDNTVDVQRAPWTNKIGGSEFLAVWQDRDFDPTQSAYYCAYLVYAINRPRA